MRKLFSIIILNGMVSGFGPGCVRLPESFFFQPNTELTEYKMDNYEKREFDLDSTYDIDPTLIHIFTLNSSDENGNPVEIYAMYIGDIARISSDKVILYCHGNSGHMDYYWPRTKLLANMNGKNSYGIFTFDYQGYGLSKGEPSEENLYRDTDAAMAWLKSKGLTDNRLIIYGYSMGTAPATNLTANAKSMQPGLLILESPFASSDIFFQDSTGLALPGSYVTNLKIDNAEQIKKVTEPFLWLHGKNDSFVNIRHGEIIFRNYGGSISQAVRVDGAGHSGNSSDFGVPQAMGFQNYLTTIHTFIAGNLP